LRSAEDVKDAQVPKSPNLSGIFKATRGRFTIPKGLIYLDGNSLGPLPNHVSERITGAINHEWGGMLIRGWMEAGWIDLPERAGGRIAKLAGAADGSVVVADTTSVNLFKALSAGLAMRPDRKVILSDTGNFPTDLYVAQRLAASLKQGHELKLVAPDEISGAIDDTVAVLMLTEVDYRTSRRHDMKKITTEAHKAGAVMLWDLAHSVGAFPVNLTDANPEFAVGCGYKYLNGGPGAPAFLYVRPDLADTVAPMLGGWMGHEEPFAFDTDYRPAQGIARMKVGTPAVLSMTSLDAALELWDDVDINQVREQAVTLTELFISEVERRCGSFGLRLASPRDPQHRGSHVSFHFEHGFAAMQALIASGVIGDFRAPDIMRFGICPLFNTAQDMIGAAEHFERVLKEEQWKRGEFAQQGKVT
jgi:kynureninase